MISYKISKLSIVNNSIPSLWPLLSNISSDSDDFCPKNLLVFFGIALLSISKVGDNYPKKMAIA